MISGNDKRRLYLPKQMTVIKVLKLAYYFNTSKNFVFLIL